MGSSSSHWSHYIDIVKSTIESGKDKLSSCKITDEVSKAKFTCWFVKNLKTILFVSLFVYIVAKKSPSSP